MKFISTITALAISGTAIALPTTRSDDSTTYQIKDFTLRKYDGVNTNTVFFDIVATNGGTLDFECAPYDPALGRTTDAFESGKVYECGQNSYFSFSYVPAHDDQTNELTLWQQVSHSETLGGSTYLDDPICHAGGSTAQDEVCSIPSDIYVAITMSKLGV